MHRLQYDHSYLETRGINARLAEAFGIGYCTHPPMSKRVCVPVCDDQGDFISYMGLWAEAGMPPDGQVRYKQLPRFNTRAFLYNLDRVRGFTELAVTQGLLSVIRLHAIGIPAVSIMGADSRAKRNGLSEAD